jgi:hypothetical protein
MPTRGRPRLSPEDLEARIADYCRRYQASRAPSGLPAFPTGKRETRQHREWISLYKAHNRLGRRTRGQCERCSEPAAEGSVFCDEHHRGQRPGPASSSLEERRALLAHQDGRCPVCGASLDVTECVEHGREAVLHPRCSRLAGLAVDLGPEGLSRLGRFLWPEGGPRKAREKRLEAGPPKTLPLRPKTR